MRVLSIDLSRLGRLARLDKLGCGHATAAQRYDVLDPAVIGPVDLAFRLAPPPASENGGPGGPLVFGAGPLSSAEIPGSNRLVFAGRSPAWKGFYVSTVGSAAQALRGVGLDAVVLSGRTSRTSVLVLREGGRASVEPLDVEAVWRRGRRGGTYALLDALHARVDGPSRVLATGPASARTAMGAIASSLFRDAGDPVIETWAGRGGFGSLLLREHGLCAIVLASAGEPVRHLAHAVVDRETLERATVKYRYHPLLQTGGTFGSNFSTLGGKMLAFNASSIHLPPDRREAMYERLVAGHYLRQFKSEMGPRESRDCGETCPAVCKKVKGSFKKDYQPYAALGPNVGVFDQRAAERLNDAADAHGFDSIDVGGLVAWAFELVGAGLAEPAAFGLSARPALDPETLDPEAGSDHNARLAIEMIDALADLDDRPDLDPLRRGLRAGARAWGGEAAERALYVAHGDGDGGVSPNQYWVPGMLAPVAIAGKYYVDYSFPFAPPEELGRRCADRMTREIALDNLGVCRFQREWAEARLGELLHAAGDPVHAGVDVDAHHRALCRSLQKRAAPRPPATRRAVEFLAEYLREVQRDDAASPALDAWVRRFGDDAAGAARAYWEALRAGIESGLSSA